MIFINVQNLYRILIMSFTFSVENKTGVAIMSTEEVMLIQQELLFSWKKQKERRQSYILTFFYFHQGITIANRLDNSCEHYFLINSLKQ